MADESLILGIGLEIFPASLKKIRDELQASVQPAGNVFKKSFQTEKSKFKTQNLQEEKGKIFSQPSLEKRNEIFRIFESIRNILLKIEINTSRKKSPFLNFKNEKFSSDFSEKSNEFTKKAFVSKKKSFMPVFDVGISNFKILPKIFTELKGSLIGVGIGIAGVMAANLKFAKLDARSATSLIEIQRGFSLGLFDLIQGTMPAMRKILGDVSRLISSPVFGEFMTELGRGVGAVLDSIISTFSFMNKLGKTLFSSLSPLFSTLVPFFNNLKGVLRDIHGMVLRLQDFLLYVAGSKHTVVGKEISNIGKNIGKNFISTPPKNFLFHNLDLKPFFERIFKKIGSETSSFRRDLQAGHLHRQRPDLEIKKKPDERAINKTINVTTHVTVKGHMDKKLVNTLSDHIAQVLQATP